MQELRGKLLGPVSFDEPTAFHGLIEGSAMATGALNMHGLITGDLIVAQRAKVEVYGTVNGMVINEGGTVQIFGTVGAVGGPDQCEIMPGAKVG